MDHADEQKYPVPSGYCNFLLETMEYNPEMKVQEIKEAWENEKKPKNLEFAATVADGDCW